MRVEKGKRKKNKICKSQSVWLDGLLLLTRFTIFGSSFSNQLKRECLAVCLVGEQLYPQSSAGTQQRKEDLMVLAFCVGILFTLYTTKHCCGVCFYPLSLVTNHGFFFVANSEKFTPKQFILRYPIFSFDLIALPETRLFPLALGCGGLIRSG